MVDGVVLVSLDGLSLLGVAGRERCKPYYLGVVGSLSEEGKFGGCVSQSSPDPISSS